MNKSMLVITLVAMAVSVGFAEDKVEYGMVHRADGFSEWSPSQIVLESGDTFQVMYSNGGSNSGGINFYIETSLLTLAEAFTSNTEYSKMYVGPCTIRFRSMQYDGMYAAYKITRAIPEGSGQLIIETSEDLIEWTPAYTGVIDMTDPTEFFRARIVNPE